MNFFEYVEKKIVALGDKSDEIIGKYPNIYLAIFFGMGVAGLLMVKPKSQMDEILLPFGFAALMMMAAIVVGHAERKRKKMDANKNETREQAHKEVIKYEN